MYTKSPLFIACLQCRGATDPTSVGVIADIRLPSEVNLIRSVGEGSIIHEDDTTHSAEAVTHTLGTLNDFDHA